MQRTLLFVKPDGVRRKLVGEIISRCERKGWRLVGMKMMQVTREHAERHYAEHKGKGFFEGLIEYVTGGPIVAMVWEGNDIIPILRMMMGATNPVNAQPGTIRGDFANDFTQNIVHGSDSPESAAREIPLFFADEELHGD
ncbi:MAG TPA: nucleoside-diphosphate kinase [bacterium]|nr:nucleoside-diphosphate kinase [bacterium]HPO10932.1 nucleoside-diphosphate kinase [bacterium]HQP99879.1 nucleoside-diphosphate kinase [bacterium]